MHVNDCKYYYLENDSWNNDCLKLCSGRNYLHPTRIFILDNDLQTPLKPHKAVKTSNQVYVLNKL